MIRTRHFSTGRPLGLHVARYSLVLVLVWIGAMKFTAYEAGAIQPLVANSPLMSWLYAIFSVQVTSNLIGVAEIAAGVLIALRPWAALACVVGSLMGTATFVITLTFLFSTPGLGTQPRRLPRAFGRARPVHPEGCGAARGRGLVARRGAERRRHEQLEQSEHVACEEFPDADGV